MKPIFITGIDTGVGKTIVSAILTEKLKADYWKPVQCGDLENSDTDEVKSLVSNSRTKFHPEAYRLSQPVSPHKAADLDGTKIELQNIILPDSDNILVVEGAGGLMVPLNEKDMMIDLIEKLGADVILVSRNYLGSINHTLLSIELLKSRSIPLKGIVFNGHADKYSEEIILSKHGVKCLCRIPQMNNLSKESVAEIAAGIELL